MTRLYLLVSFLFLSTISYAIGIGVVDAQAGKYLKTDSSIVTVKVEGQISITTAYQVFTNDLPVSVQVKYAFPLPEQASPTALRYRINNVWQSASISGNQQDTTLPGGTVIVNENLKTYLGASGVYFSIPVSITAANSIAIEITYVEFLPYKFGQVTYTYPSDYSLIQRTPLNYQELNFSLNSQRLIDSIVVLSNHPVASLINGGLSGSVLIKQFETAASAKYKIKYVLNSNQLGLFGYSTLPADSLMPDKLGGVFSFIAEPNATQTTYIKKYFTLMIDRSGSMDGIKMTQAKSAATFILNNLNEGDMFNIVSFNDQISSFQTSHVPYNNVYRDSALKYVSSLFAYNGTNISGAFATALPQFSKANDSTANIIIFLTDGQQTVGILDFNTLINYVDELVAATVKKVYLYNFGIGSDVNYQLLTILARNNRGLAEFLGNDEVYSRITDFYMTIRNPVLLNTSVSFSPNNVYEVYPDTLQNLYKGQQLIVAARYKTAGNVKITLSGLEYSKLVTYTYNVTLADSNITNNAFLTKVWAKKKIETLVTRYFMSDPNSQAAEQLKNEIIRISKAYSIVSPFTSFSVPVKMTSFSGYYTPKGMQLIWSTATELNNFGFVIERKLDNGSFIEVGFKRGKGSTAEPSNYSFIDQIFLTGKYYYRLKQVDYDGTYEYSKIIEIDFTPESYQLYQNFPNPFNPVTTIKFSIPKDGFVTLTVYNAIGQKLSTLVNEYKKTGIYNIEFNAEKLASGIYFYKLECGSFVSTKKMLVLK